MVEHDKMHEALSDALKWQLFAKVVEMLPQAPEFAGVAMAVEQLKSMDMIELPLSEVSGLAKVLGLFLVVGAVQE